jgi:hypothetical protein
MTDNAKKTLKINWINTTHVTYSFIHSLQVTATVARTKSCAVAEPNGIDPPTPQQMRISCKTTDRQSNFMPTKVFTENSRDSRIFANFNELTLLHY